MFHYFSAVKKTGSAYDFSYLRVNIGQSFKKGAGKANINKEHQRNC